MPARIPGDADVAQNVAQREAESIQARAVEVAIAAMFLPAVEEP
jgi:hypothetical protein